MSKTETSLLNPNSCVDMQQQHIGKVGGSTGWINATTKATEVVQTIISNYSKFYTFIHVIHKQVNLPQNRSKKVEN